MSDNASPALSDAKSFTVIVRKKTSATLTLVNPKISSNGTVSFTFRPDPGVTYRILWSSDLGGGVWAVLKEIASTESDYYFEDTSTQGTTRFYKVQRVD